MGGKGKNDQSAHDGESVAALSPYEADYRVYTPTRSSTDEAAAEYQRLSRKSSAFAVAGTEEEKAELCSFGEYFQFADGTDKLLMVFGLLSALGNGTLQPISIIMFGDMMNAFNEPGADISDSVNEISIRFVILGAIATVLGLFQVLLWTVTAARQTRKIRETYVAAVFKQNIGWFDVNNPGALPTLIADQSVLIQDGMGRKIGDGIFNLSLFVAGFVVAYTQGWKLALVLTGALPFLALVVFYMMKIVGGATKAGAEAYGKAGAVAEEVLSSIRTVSAFCAQEREAKRYDVHLAEAQVVGVKKSLRMGFGGGLMFFVIFCTYAFGMYFGARFVGEDTRDGCTEDCYDGGRVLIVFFCVIMGSMGIGQAAPSFQAIIAGRAAAKKVFDLIHRVPDIDVSSHKGAKLENVSGDIELSNVHFRYPSRPNVKIAQGMTLSVTAGQTVALVGPSGCGKSTIVNLLERFYDPEKGQLTLDGHDIKSLNLKWLRTQIGLVGQEPVLFAASIEENIAFGKPGGASREEVEKAAKMANAYNFIVEFPHGFETEVGEKGVQLSGGQKQRIAIARAIIRDPAILLLDEATSALDTESERIVQESLDRLLKLHKRTTIIIAHRLSTIRDADCIFVINEGVVTESGRHGQLMKMEDGIYRSLVHAQLQGQTTDERDGVEPQAPPLKKASTAKMSKKKLSAISSASSGFGVGPGLGRWSGARVSFQDDISERSSRQSRLSDLSNVEIVEDEEEKPEEELYKVPLSRVWQLSKPEWTFCYLGCFGSAINGVTFPIWGVLLTKVLVLFYTPLPFDELMERALYWSLGFVGLGLAFLCSSLLQWYCFGIFGEALTRRLRLMCFSSMIRQEIGWYDLDENATGALTTRLATDASLVQASTGELLNRYVAVVFTLLCGLIIAFVNSWKMTLVTLGIIPLLGFAGWAQFAAFAGVHDQEEQGAAGALLSEAIGGIRTVAACGLEKPLWEVYSKNLDKPMKEGIKKGYIGGLGFGISQFIFFGAYGLLFWFGGTMVPDEISFEQMNTVIMAIMLSAFGMGNATQGMADAKKAKEAVSNIFSLIDRVPLIDSLSTEGQQLSKVEGDISLDHIDFTYPARPDTRIAKGYTLEIKQGTTVALVGSSGCGKSTAVSLIERFYDPDAGVVRLDGHDIRELNLPWLRNQLGLVQQEPVLFSGSIADNIAYGKPDASMGEIEHAAKSANAHNFILSFPDKYNTEVGDRGVQLSGGQKQRIAIARAIIRNPQILLLDEATSALDAESERVVQESLDRLLRSKKRTTIVIAHRLSTIRNADVIAVIHNGRVVEKGKHNELMKIDGGHYKLLVERSGIQ